MKTDDVVNGAFAGLIATAPMTIIMEGLHRFLPGAKQSLPPQEINQKVAKETGVGDKATKRQEWGVMTIITHFLYGAGTGALYLPLTSKIPLPPIVRGIIYGLIVWVVNYLGLLPAAKIMPPATEQPARRNFLMIMAHVVWGASVAIITEKTKKTTLT